VCHVSGPYFKRLEVRYKWVLLAGATRCYCPKEAYLAIRDFAYKLLAQFVLQLYNRLSDFPENASPLIHLVIISPPLLTMSIRTASVSSLLSEMSCSPRQITSSAPDSSPAVLDAFSRCESRSLLELGRPSACFFSRLTTCFDPH
jgi:hypothetical protein